MLENGQIQYLRCSDAGMELIYCRNSDISYPLHNHISVVTIGIILEGTVLVTIGQITEQYCKNRAFVIHPYMPHCIKAQGNYTLLSICIQKNRFNYCNDRINFQADQNADLNFIRVKTDLAKCLETVADICEISREHIRLLLYAIGSEYNVVLGWLISGRLYFDKLLPRLERFPEDKISIDEMASLPFVSKYHFIRCFKQEVGLTPHRFQIQNRVRKAQHLLEQTGNTAEVALSAGFCDQSHFIKQFEKYVGLTPAEYRMSCGSLSI